VGARAESVQWPDALPIMCLYSRREEGRYRVLTPAVKEKLRSPWMQKFDVHSVPCRTYFSHLPKIPFAGKILVIWSTSIWQSELLNPGTMNMMAVV
jgi:hypothetical protein